MKYKYLLIKFKRVMTTLMFINNSYRIIKPIFK